MPHPDGDRERNAIPGEAVRRRDRGLRRVSRTTLGVAVVAAAGSVALGTSYAQTMAAAASPSAPQPAATQPAATSAPKPRSTIQAPAQPPTPTQQAPQTTSGAS